MIHAAGKAHSVPKTDSEKKEFFDVNAGGTINLLNALQNGPFLPKFFILISTVAVYGQELGTLINEDHPLLAMEPYGKSKIEAEKLVAEWCKNNNVVCSILRLPLVVGANPPGNLKAMINAIVKGYYLNISGGKAKKSMVVAEDVANILLKVAPIGGIYNLTDGIHPSFKELTRVIAAKNGLSEPKNIPEWFAKIIAILGDLVGSSAPINTDKLKKIISDLTFDDSKAIRELNWKPQSVLNYMVR